MEVFDQGAIERDHAERAKKQKEWAFWVTLVHDVTLPRGTWTVDGEPQEAEFNAANVKAVALAAGAKKATVAVAAPLHITAAEFAGFAPPYVGLESPSAAEATLPT